jgi:hypothetical protein
LAAAAMIGLGILDTARALGATRLKGGPVEFAGPCPKCGGRDRFSINTKKGVFNCRGCGVGGDVVDLVRHINDCSYREALACLGREDVKAMKRAPAPPEPVKTEPRIAELIAGIIHNLVPVRGSPGGRYLRETRRIDTDAIADVLARVDAIGWHPGLRFSQPNPSNPLHDLDRRWFGAIIGIMTDPVTAEPTGAISRTYITADLRKVCGAKTLGKPRGIIRLDEDASVTYALNLAEGIETALTAIARGFRPCWSIGDKAMMAAFPVLAGIESLTLFADNDPDGGGLRAAQEAQTRWLTAGREARVFMTDKFGDLNDLLVEGGAAP